MRRTSLEDEYEWYRQQAENPENTPEERDLWRQLAEGLAHRIGQNRDQESLW